MQNEALFGAALGLYLSLTLLSALLSWTGFLSCGYLFSSRGSAFALLLSIGTGFARLLGVLIVALQAPPLVYADAWIAVVVVEQLFSTVATFVVPYDGDTKWWPWRLTLACAAGAAAAELGLAADVNASSDDAPSVSIAVFLLAAGFVWLVLLLLLGDPAGLLRCRRED